MRFVIILIKLLCMYMYVLHYTSYHHRQLLLKATTSGTELITDLSLPDRAGHLVDSNFISRMIFKDMN